MIRPEEVSFNTDDVVVYLAAAGAGKTSVLMEEMTHLLKTYRPDEIAFVTFTRKGVANGIERALQANPYLTVDDLIHFRTLHALCFRELGLTYDSIITQKDMREFNARSANAGLYFKINLNNKAFEYQTDDDKLLSRYDVMRNNSRTGLYAYEHENNFDVERYERLVRAYEAFKKAEHKLDFYDCLYKFSEEGKPLNVKVAFIDEAQDLTLLQWKVCQIAFADCEKIRIAGDDFQAVFSYSGASFQTLISLAQRYKAVKLERSYRLPGAVYRFSKGITSLIQDKFDKDYKPAKDFEGFVEDITDSGLLIRNIERDVKKNGFRPYRWYLLFRNNCFIDKIEDMLAEKNIPYHTAGDFCIPERDLIKIKRYYNFRKQGFGTDAAREKFCTAYHIEDLNKEFVESGLIVSEKKRGIYFDYVQRYGVDALETMCRREPCILLSTTHKVKGGEADYVALFLDCTQQVAKNISVNVDEELRVLYVACTRAKVGLYLVQRQGEYGLDDVIDLV